MKMLVVMTALSVAMLATAAQAASAFNVAITVDDLPAHGSATPGMTRTEIGRSYIAALKAHKVPAVFGFVNAIHLSRDASSEQVLNDWRAAGYPLGSHTYSHKGINEGTVEDFEADIVRNELVLQKFMAGADWHYLRFPYLNAGDAAHHDPVNAWLKDHGYRIAEASFGFDDWAYTEAYNRCLARGDATAIAALRARYLRGAGLAITRMKALSETVYGRMIPQVLLIHIGGFSAVTLPDVLDQLDAAGARYVSLEQAQSDPAYAQTDPRAGEGTVMERTAFEKGIDISHVPASQDYSAIDPMCR